MTRIVEILLKHKPDLTVSIYQSLLPINQHIYVLIDVLLTA